MQADDSEPDTIWDRDNAGSYAGPLQPALCEQLVEQPQTSYATNRVGVKGQMIKFKCPPSEGS